MREMTRALESLSNKAVAGSLFDFKTGVVDGTGKKGG